ncbi:MAG: UDP-N-acetylglucosamine--N-acetylmuramyl-(pentapeptide) pyrophosphoryl-undecaprenol N-acetylglucosamine transferase [Erysipelotrichaceae bacterium]|nr:UDP-N-acetylglucosamine--N-acetylmuramyl-(pentapeptide) pyrophosphoryl-undecaprenol N-acetylglucosamine transferase [Erysipelotrichaceae bacterium]
MRIAMVAGGSGGHIYPALSLAKELVSRGHSVAFIGADNRIEKDIIPENHFEFIGLAVRTTKGGPLQKVISLFSMFASYREAKKILKGRFDLVIGFGNYISVPVVLAAKSLGIRIMLHEQNSFVGRANRFLDEKADLIVGSYEENLKQFKNPKIKILGNPQSSIAAAVKRNDSLFGDEHLSKDVKTVLIFFGSLGSETLMKTVCEYFKIKSPGYQVLYATGNTYYDAVLPYDSEEIRIEKRIDGTAWMKDADLFVGRAGATTLAEVIATGVPSVLIPSPYVPNNHQYFNARALSDKNAAVLIEEKQLTPELLKKTIEDLLADDEARANLSKQTESMRNDHVIDDIIDEIEKL